MKTPRPPGPRDHFLGLSLLRDMERDYLAFWRDTHARHGDAVCIRTGPYLTFSFAHPDLIRAVLVDHADAFIRYERHMDVLSTLHGQSVLIAEGDTWRRQRRMLLPAFQPKRFGGYARQMTAAVADMLDGLAKNPAAARAGIDLERVMDGLTMDVVLRTMFGARLDEDVGAIEDAVRMLSRIAYREMFAVVPLPDWLPLPSKRAKRERIRLLHDLIGTRIRARRAAIAAGAPGDAQDLLGMLLTATDTDGSTLTDLQVRDQLTTVFLAGHDTTASGLAWACWALAAHPAIAASAAREVDEVLRGRLPAAADAAALPRIGMVVRETLRLYPPAPGVFMRRATADVRIGEWLVPKGSLVSILSTVPHRDPRWFPEPLRFDPERFSEDNARALPRGAYIPFGTGPRVCIGNSFATLEMTLALAMLLQRFRLRPAAGQLEPALDLQVTIRPQGGIRLILEERRDAPAARAPDAASVMAPGPASCPFHHPGTQASADT